MMTQNKYGSYSWVTLYREPVESVGFHFDVNRSEILQVEHKYSHPALIDMFC